MKEEVKITAEQDPAGGIDINKLKLILRNNIFWLIIIFISANACAYLYIRYTKNIYESVSEIKLDIKQEASEFGLRDFTNNQDLKLVSGEIENIQSKSFLSSIIDSLDIQVSYYSIGQVLNNELYKASPFYVQHSAQSSRHFNTPFKVEPINNHQFKLVPAEGPTLQGTYGEIVEIDGLSLTLVRNNNNDFESGNNYSFVINSRPVLLDYLMNNLSVEPLNLNANTIKVSFKDYNPTKAHNLVNQIDSLYLLYSYDQKNRANRQKIEWLTSELNQIETRMEGFEDYFEDFTLRNKTYDLESDLKKTVEAIHAIDSQRFEVTVRIQETNKIIQMLEMNEAEFGLLQLNRLPEHVNNSINKLHELYLEMDRMRLSYNEQTFAYKKKQNEITAIKNNLNGQLEELKKGLLAELQKLASTKSRLEIEFATMPDKNTQYSKNQRFYKLYEEFYLTLMQNKSEFEIAQAGSTPEFKILSAATLPSEPISPNKPIIYGIGFVAGFSFCILFLGLSYVMNNKVTSLGELERVAGVPALGVIPALRYVSGRSDLHLIEQPKSMVSEAFRSLRTNLDFFSANSDKKVIVISSTVSGEGKSFVAENLGAALAQSNKKVVLIDLDMRKTHKVNISKQPKDQSNGISRILINKIDWRDCIINTTQERFDFIPAGTQPPNPAELLLNGSFVALIDELKSQYDFVILDTPPVGLVADGITAMKKADISIYIFRANYSKKDFLHSLRRVVNLNKLSNVTTVLNGMPVPYDSYGYGYYEDRPQSGLLKSLFNKHV